MSSDAPTTLWPSLALVAVTGLLVGVPLRLDGFSVDPLWLARATLPSFAAALCGGLALRLVIQRVRLRTWPRWSARRWPGDLGRVLLAWAALVGLVTVYCWGKLLIPWFRSGTLDGPLYEVERAVHFGLDPGAVLHAVLAGAPWADTALDWTYAKYTVVLLGIVGWNLSDPDVDGRHRWFRGFVLLWLAGLALYWALPALGPAFVFPDLAPVLSTRYPIAHATQRMLIENYENVRAILDGTANVPLRLELGIAAFPSLHVAVPAHAWLHARERRQALRLPLLVTTLLFLVGSVATGWHYLVDGWAGIALATACWLATRPRRAGAARTSDAAPA